MNFFEEKIKLEIEQSPLIGDLCDRCEQTVPNYNNAVVLDYVALQLDEGDNALEEFNLLTATPRHLYPEGDCRGSESRVRLLERGTDHNYNQAHNIMKRIWQ